MNLSQLFKNYTYHSSEITRSLFSFKRFQLTGNSKVVKIESADLRKKEFKELPILCIKDTEIFGFMIGDYVDMLWKFRNFNTRRKMIQYSSEFFAVYPDYDKKERLKTKNFEDELITAKRKVLKTLKEKILNSKKSLILEKLNAAKSELFESINCKFDELENNFTNSTFSAEAFFRDAGTKIKEMQTTIDKISNFSFAMEVLNLNSATYINLNSKLKWFKDECNK